MEKKLKKKGWFARYLDRLAKTNKEIFDKGKLDCCSLNCCGPNMRKIK